MAYEDYHYYTIGRVLKFLHVYCPGHLADRVTVSGDEVRSGSTLVATYVWEAGNPVFTFVGAYAHFNQSQEQLCFRALHDIHVVWVARARAAIERNDPVVTKVMQRYSVKSSDQRYLLNLVWFVDAVSRAMQERP